MEYKYEEPRLLLYLVYLSVVVSVIFNTIGIEYGILTSIMIFSYIIDLYIQKVYTKMFFILTYFALMIFNLYIIYKYENSIYRKIILIASFFLATYFTITDHYRYWNNQGLLVFVGVFLLYMINIRILKILLNYFKILVLPL